jgi:uncharacterized protein YfaP (DUF2135 family)
MAQQASIAEARAARQDARLPTRVRVRHLIFPSLAGIWILVATGGCDTRSASPSNEIPPETEGLVADGRVLFDSGAPVAGAAIRGSLVSDAAIEAVRVGQREQQVLHDWTSPGFKETDGRAHAARTLASPVLATPVAAETVTGADGRFAIEFGTVPLPARVLVEVTFQSDALPAVANAKWGTTESDALDMGTIVLPDPQGTEMPLVGGAAQNADGSVKVSGLPGEVSRVFARSYDPDRTPGAFPGEFAEMGAIPLDSSLFLWVEALDAAGNPVDDLTQAAIIRARVPRSQWLDLVDIDSGTDRIEVPIYSFDESISMWEQMGIGWLEDERGARLPEDAQASILDGSFPREILAAFVTRHLSWMNVDYAYIGPWTLSRLDITKRNNDCLFNATQLAKTIARSAKGQAAYSVCVQPGTDINAVLGDANGPEIRGTDFPPPGLGAGRGLFGWFSPFEFDQVHLIGDLWNSCGPDASEQQKKEATWRLANAILHETAHWLCHAENVSEEIPEIIEGPVFEAGWFVTGEIFGGLFASLTADSPILDIIRKTPVSEFTLDAWLDPASWPPASGVAPRIQPAVPLQSSPLDIAIALPGSTFELGEEIRVTVTYTNVSSAPIEVLGFIVLEGHPLGFEIVREGETDKVPFAGLRAHLGIGPDDFVVLDPGSSLERTVGLLRDTAGGRLYDLAASGNYHLTAVYSSLWGLPGTRSNTITFTVGPGGGISGVVSDATNLEPVSGATVTAIQNGSVLATTTTGADGRYSIPELPSGTYTVQARASGFLRSQRENLQVVGGQTTTVNFSLSSLLTAGELRIVLSWGERPRDLDAHLWLPMETPYHLFFARTGNLEACPFAALDTDALFGFGPETITVSQRLDGTYVYSVHQFVSADGALTTSGAQVQVFDASGLVVTFDVPAQGTGEWWNVLSINGATSSITEINQIGNDQAPYPDTGEGCSGVQ